MPAIFKDDKLIIVPQNFPFAYAIKQFKSEHSLGDTIGIFKDKDEALKRILNNQLDMSENGYYKYVVLFPINEGLYSVSNPENEKWYKWDKENKKYITIDRPKFIENLALML